MIEYKLKPLELSVESVEDIYVPELKDRVIEKTGHTVEFSLADTELDLKNIDKNLLELKAKKELEDAKCENISSFHPFVLELTDEELHTAWLYQQSKAVAELCDKKIEALEEERVDYLKEIENIKSQIPELNG